MFTIILQLLVSNFDSFLNLIFVCVCVCVCVLGGGEGGGTGRGDNFTHLCWVSLGNSEMLQAVTLVFCSIQYHFIWDIRAKIGAPYWTQFPDLGQNSDGIISDFRISGQFLIKGNFHNSRTSDNIGIKIGPVTKLDTSKKTTSKNVKMTSCWKIPTSFLFFQFRANLGLSRSRIPDV